MKIVLTFLLFALVLQAEMLTRTKVMMGTFATVTLDREDSAYFKGVFRALKRVESSLSSYDSNSPIYKLNHEKSTQIDLYTFEALSLSKRYYLESYGYFNIAIGSITKDLYRFGEEERLPSAYELNTTTTSLLGLHFNEYSAQINRDEKVDLGGMGKGFAIDRAVEYLKINGVTKGSVALSGDIRCMDSCRVEIKNPFGTSPLASFYTNAPDIGVTTSGNYNRYVKSTQNNHLINPKTKHSQQNFVSITLVSSLPSSDLDAYATAASVMPRELAYRFLNSIDVIYFVLETDGSFHMSDNQEKYLLLPENTTKKNPEKIDK